ncbi:DUF2071 domain-containing protein [Winogradskyella eckloniae]|uniref:DUF2071 domain-containing protein n=1 Tax=Winogradskyella eckloniae TaxID=1089306 RepID=UPI001564BF1C|nr:DUF2071 domain-containing protein [Winogradskyella eckloniae]NRD20989.1 DUF2071 domain-containing protein [Winogradskyella eckloniae]
MTSKSYHSNNIFMTGHWEDLIISTFEVDKEILESYLPNNTELDLYNGKALMSMVAFTFSKVNFFGVKIPFHQHFGQINFRFYAKSTVDGTKGVVFIREFAPKPLIALTANLCYNEPYFYKNIKVRTTKHKAHRTLKYSYKSMQIAADVSHKTTALTEKSFDKFIVDRYIAFVKQHKTKTMQYKIQHRPWKIVQAFTIHNNNNIISMLPKVFKNAKYIKTCVVDGSFVSVEQGQLQPNRNPNIFA